MTKKLVVVLSDGVKIVLTDSPNSPTGIQYATYSPNGNGARQVDPSLVYESKVRNPDDFSRQISTRDTLGFFDDPRKAAYMSGYYTENPQKVLNAFENLVKQGPGYRQAVYGGALCPPPPADLFEKIPSPDPTEIKAIASEKGKTPSSKSVGSKRTLPMSAWKTERERLGIKHGSQVLAALPGGDTTENRKFLSSLGQLSASDAIQALADKGVDFDDPEVMAKIKAAPVLSESFIELDRIKQLTETILKR